jgi:hypothetical protein
MLTTPTMDTCRSMFEMFLNVGNIDGAAMVATTHNKIRAIYGPLVGLLNILFRMNPSFTFTDSCTGAALPGPVSKPGSA